MGFLDSIFSRNNNRSYLRRLISGIDLEDNITDTSTANGIEKAYKDCEIVQSIVNNCRELSKNHKLYLKTKDGLGNEIPVNNPNFNQTYYQFYSDIIQQLQLYRVVVIVKNVGIVSKNPYYEVLNYPDIAFDWRNAAYKERRKLTDLKKITYESVDYLPDQLIYIGDKSVLLTNEFRHSGIKYPVSNLIIDYQAKHGLINEKGAIGILSPDPSGSNGKTFDGVQLDKTQRDELEKDLSKKYGITAGKKKFYISNSPLRYSSLVMSIADLKISEDKKENEEAICHHFNYPKTLLGDVTFENQRTARASIYNNILIPLSKEIESFIKILTGQDVVIDYSDNDELQDNKKDLVERNAKVVEYCAKAVESGLMTPEEAKQELSKYI